MAESSSSLAIPDANSNESRKRRKIDPDSRPRIQPEPGQTRWRTQLEQHMYSSKLIDALRHIRRPDSTGLAVRDAADRVLAASARGRTRWSRAILTNRLSLRLAHINRKHRKAVKPKAGKPRKPAAAQKKLPPVQRKVKLLSRLVPGCRKASLPNLLEETSDYIAALEMQVKAMTFLTGLLNGGAISSS